MEEVKINKNDQDHKSMPLGETMSEVQEHSFSVLSAYCATLHARHNEVTTDEELLNLFTREIRKHLKGSQRELARVGATLCFAKRKLANGQELSEERESTFTKWYQQFGCLRTARDGL